MNSLLLKVEQIDDILSINSWRAGSSSTGAHHSLWPAATLEIDLVIVVH